MSYLPLALITMALLGVHYFLVKVISPYIGGPVILVATSIVTLPFAFAYIYLNKMPFVPEQKIYLGYAFLVSVPLAIGLLTLFLAITRGPVSVVMPIYALNATVTAALGILILHEPTSLSRVLGLILAVAAIVLLSR